MHSSMTPSTFPRLILLGLLLACSVSAGQLCSDAKIKECAVCCVVINSEEQCVEQDKMLTCRLKPQEDFEILVITLLIILGFALGKTPAYPGIPLLIMVIDLVVIKRPYRCKMSVCEFLINYMCLCKCCQTKKGAK